MSVFTARDDKKVETVTLVYSCIDTYQLVPDTYHKTADIIVRVYCPF